MINGIPGGLPRIRDGFAHWLRTMVQRTGNEDAKAAEEGAAGGANVEPKEAWTPVTAEEADRVVRALVAGDEAAGGERDDASPASGTGSKAPHGATPRAAVRKSRALTVIGGVVAVAVVASAARWLLSHRNSAPSAPARASLQDSGTTGGASFAPTGTADGYEQDSGMNRSTTAALVAGVAGLAIAGGAGAQNAAVQWKVANGGNGHWYEFVRRGEIVCWPEARDASVDRSGHLVTLASSAENEFVKSMVARQDPGVPEGGPFIGASCGAGSWGVWSWVTAEPFTFAAWAPGEPNNAGDGECYVQYWRWSSLGWNDTSACSSLSFVVEWDADCNSDGIVDYGQCHDGTLTDYNGNNIPDCCERGEACVVGSYPVQWRIEDGGNGHWYQLVLEGHPSWTQAKLFAEQRGGYLATLTSQAENDLAGRLSHGLNPMLLGGFQDHSSQSYSEPGGGWRWVTNEPWAFTNWGAGEPNNASNGHGEPGEDYLYSWTVAEGYKWNDGDNICPECPPSRFLVEWSADCNQDNIVDYGQILTGQIADANANDIPDVCEVPTCRDVDLFRDDVVNGADLGILLAQWGPANSGTVSDINHDGRVDGSDLGTLLAFWGACPN